MANNESIDGPHQGDANIRYPSVSLQQYIEMMMNERDKRYEDKFAAKDYATNQAQRAAKEAVDKAQSSMERRLEAMNEFRAAINDIISKTVTRTEATTAHEGMNKEITRIASNVELRVSAAMPRSEYTIQHGALMDALNTHILTENEKTAAQEEKQDAKLKVLTDRVDGVNKWLVGALGGVIIALILTVVDILVRQFG
jgi:hypothetical protein